MTNDVAPHAPDPQTNLPSPVVTALRQAGIGRRWHTDQLSSRPYGETYLSWVKRYLTPEGISRNFVIVERDGYERALLLARTLVILGHHLEVIDYSSLLPRITSDASAPAILVLTFAGEANRDGPYTPYEQRKVEEYLMYSYFEEGLGIVLQGSQPDRWFSPTFWQVVESLGTDVGVRRG